MRSPKDMRIIQIDITNACSLTCSNCTRFCGNHRLPFFMDELTFMKAVDSLKGFERTISIMGGEPTLHPKFELFARYLAEKHPPRYLIKPLRYPVRDFISYIRDKNYFWDESINIRKGPGLCTATGKNYYEHFELIQDVFSFQLINDHMNNTLHQPILVSRKDVGISDSEWIQRRDNCWIQNLWSATITPKGAFFCEIAGALDMLFDGPGGWPIEPFWWKREPSDFGEQLNWCELCGAALSTKGRLSSERIDDVSQTLFDMLLKVDSPKVKQGLVSIVSPDAEGISSMPNTINRYISSYSERISSENRSLSPRNLQKYKLDDSTSLFDIPELLDKCGDDWVLLFIGKEPVSKYLDDIHQYILNPGVLYSLRENAVMFNIRALALRNVFGSHCFYSFIDLWTDDKKVHLSEDDIETNEAQDLMEWISFAKDHAMLTVQVRKALKKIASDQSINFEDTLTLLLT